MNLAISTPRELEETSLSHLLNAHTEIRLRIWKFALEKPANPQSWHHLAVLDLLCTSRQIHDEASAILYGENKYRLDAFFIPLTQRCIHLGPRICGALRSLTLATGRNGSAFLQEVAAYMPYLVSLTVLPNSYADVYMLGMLAQILHEPLSADEPSPIITVVIEFTRDFKTSRRHHRNELENSMKLARELACAPPALKQVVIQGQVQIEDWCIHWEQFVRCGWTFGRKDEAEESPGWSMILGRTTWVWRRRSQPDVFTEE